MNGSYTAFLGSRRLVTGALSDVLARVKSMPSDPNAELLIFEDRTGQSVDFDLRGDLQDVLARAQPEAKPPGRGRPKLGVVSREVTLLPRHWEWLEAQQGGASAVLRRLVDEARKQDPSAERVRAAQGAADRFMAVLAGNLAGYQEASRALYARDASAFKHHTQGWPEDVREHALSLAAPAFTPDPPSA
ncbi:DUF2239 family protein [Deinococcus hopiensis]|uniref:DUF2239 domain-containing protein n=1 Tax=Deinococcus hopiensis KR-140 TaxID=695939 RepID=A0A1W1UTW8_9DEIO|nr:DUF2239 family protein [Deinococcus hopiensis]SMB84503.1 hypothetical protein SAMN00790413_05161 [Deinococcus hopiensis KR-140]